MQRWKLCAVVRSAKQDEWVNSWRESPRRLYGSSAPVEVVRSRDGRCAPGFVWRLLDSARRAGGRGDWEFAPGLVARGSSSGWNVHRLLFGGDTFSKACFFIAKLASM